MRNPHDILERLRSVLHQDRFVELISREAADEIERLRNEVDRIKNRMADIDVLVQKEMHFARLRNTGTDASYPIAIRVITQFTMTPEFLDDLGDLQYDHIGDTVGMSLRKAVAESGDKDLRDFASAIPMRVAQ